MEAHRGIKLIALMSLMYLTSATCEAPQTKPCEPVTIYVTPNYDSALLHFAPHTNLQTDTANYRDEIRKLKSENLNLASHNAKLSLLISQQRARILADEIKLRHCVWIQDTANIKR